MRHRYPRYSHMSRSSQLGTSAWASTSDGWYFMVRGKHATCSVCTGGMVDQVRASGVTLSPSAIYSQSTSPEPSVMTSGPRGTLASARGRETYLCVSVDPSYLCFGYPYPKGTYHPLHDPASLAPVEERLEKFGVWVSSYFTHGDLLTSGLKALEDRNAAEDLLPTVATMSTEEIAESSSAAGARGAAKTCSQGHALPMGYTSY